VAACPDEANEFFDYLATSAAGSLDRGGDLQIMFGIGGERDLTERELPHLEGWRHSVPVRVGNRAWNQRQLDVYGELLSAVHRLSDHVFDNTSRVGPMASLDKWGAPPDLAPATRRFFVQLADTAAPPLLHPDETTGRAAGALAWVHVACTEYLTLLHVGGRSSADIDNGGVLPGFTGVLVRDGYAGYDHLPGHSFKRFARTSTWRRRD
jgi:hypothetical protein